MTDLHEGYLVTPSLELVRPLGSGGMGSVWVAQHLTLHTDVVVKFLSFSMVNDGVLRARFSQEAAAASKVKSPHVVQMIDHGVAPNGQPFIAMELLEGETLAGRLRRERTLRAQDTVAIVSQVCKALTRAHDRGIVHRDIKPDNIFLCDAHEGEIFVKVLDFGIAKLNEHPEGATQTGQAIGTPTFMSPEQLVGSKDIDRRSDLWSLGVLTFILLTGTKPFKGGSIGSVALAVYNEPKPVPTTINPALPPTFNAWFDKACSLEPENRFQTARELGEALGEALGVSLTGPRALGALGAIPTGGFPSVTPPPGPVVSEQPQETQHGPLAQSIAPEALTHAPTARSRAPLFIGVAAVVAAMIGVVVMRGSSSAPPQVNGTEPERAVEVHAKPSTTASAAPVVSATPDATPSAAPAPKPSSDDIE